MLTDSALIAWLCFFRFQNWNDVERTVLPTKVTAALVKRGWITLGEGVDWEGDRSGHITDAGIAVTDINGADFGIDTIPSSEEVS